MTKRKPRRRFSLYLPRDLCPRVDKIAVEQHMCINQALVHLVAAGLRAVERDRAELVIKEATP